tara:strand:- start:22 stop:249 length:228 start_codon:yes stop_codon:yes gene_type:complete
MEKLTQQEVDAIHNIFTQFDKNKNDSIDKKELSTLSIALNDPLSPAELSDLFKIIDTDNSGYITWKEFITYWGNN